MFQRVFGLLMLSAGIQAIVLPASVALGHPPLPPVLMSPADQGAGYYSSADLEVTVTDPESDAMDVTFYGRPVDSATANNFFTVVMIPDTQRYTCLCEDGAVKEMFWTQTQWAADHRDDRRVAFVAHVGDITEHGDDYWTALYEWPWAEDAAEYLENATGPGYPDGIPYSFAVGNHDQTPKDQASGDTTKKYNEFFGVSRFSGRAYYGGHYGSKNDNHYSLFSAGGLDFIVISIEYDAPTEVPAVVTWADNLLAMYPDRLGIIVHHHMIDTSGNFSSDAQAIYYACRDNPNLFLMLCGHIGGEAVRTDVYEGNTVHTILADYQGSTNGGNGYMRILEFYPGYNRMDVKTYSPYLDQYQTDANSQFSLPVDLGMGGNPFVELGTVSGVASGGKAEFTWSGLGNDQAYEWYVEVSDGADTRVGPYWHFTNGPGSKVVDTFDYAAGSVLDGHNGGIGWAGPWRDASDGVQVVGGNLDSAAYPFESDPGSRVGYGPGGSGALAQRVMDFSLDLSQDANQMYVSCLMSKGGTSASSAEDVQVQASSEADMRFRFAMRSDDDWLVQAGSSDTQHATTGGPAVATGTTYFVIARLVSSAAGPDEAWLKVFGPGDAVPATEAGITWDLHNANMNSNAALDRINLRIGMNNQNAAIDNLRIGTTWAEVAVAPVPPASPGDFDDDGDRDQEDYAFLQNCLGTDDVLSGDPCAPALLDDDDEVGDADAVLFFGCMSGPEIPLDPDCIP